MADDNVKEDVVAAPAVTVTAPAIYMALIHVGAELAKVGVAKDRKNETQGFKFRGIDEVMNTVSPIMARHFVVFLPNYADYPDTERITGKGATLIFAKVKGTFSFVSAVDGSAVSVTTFGVAMDTGDKATNKAMSASLKYALMQTFLIPTEGDTDADATASIATVEKAPAGFDQWFADLEAAADNGFEVMTEAWRHSTKTFTDYAKKYREDDLAKAKRRAIKVTNDAKPPAAKKVAK